jgi:hypothetical protein
VILDCYQLAWFYRVNPEIFLNMPLSEMRLHFMRTNEMDKRRQQSVSDDG